LIIITSITFLSITIVTNIKCTIRITEKATFITDRSKKEENFHKLDKIVKGMYKSWDSPILEIFYVSSGELKLATGFNPPEIINY